MQSAAMRTHCLHTHLLDPPLECSDACTGSAQIWQKSAHLNIWNIETLKLMSRCPIHHGLGINVNDLITRCTLIGLGIEKQEQTQYKCWKTMYTSVLPASLRIPALEEKQHAWRWRLRCAAGGGIFKDEDEVLCRAAVGLVACQTLFLVHASAACMDWRGVVP